MKKSILAVCIALVSFTSCEVEYRGDARYSHYRGYEHRHYPDHHDEYNHGYHHDEHGGERR
ncbi:MAG TPA: hypothetical protein VNZ86_01925 [Bacteroidia bacterium]|nr:hypothetical protein [Bacteroidia bacterium]